MAVKRYKMDWTVKITKLEIKSTTITMEESDVIDFQRKFNLKLTPI